MFETCLPSALRGKQHDILLRVLTRRSVIGGDRIVSNERPVHTTPVEFENATSHHSVWICVVGNLGQGNHLITVRV